MYECQVALTATWIINLTVANISILDLYIKIFKLPKFITIVYAYMVVEVFWGLAGFLQAILLCRPIQFNWDKTIPNGVCGSYPKAYTAAHVVILILDFGVAVLPIPILWRLQMPTRKKVGISIMFAIGIVIGVIDMCRVAWRSKIDSSDSTYAYAVLFMFTLLEPELGIVLACLPLCQPVAHTFIDSPAVTWSRRALNSLWTHSRPGNTTQSKFSGLSSSRHRETRMNQDDFTRLPEDS